MGDAHAATYVQGALALLPCLRKHPARSRTRRKRGAPATLTGYLYGLTPAPATHLSHLWLAALGVYGCGSELTAEMPDSRDAREGVSLHQVPGPSPPRTWLTFLAPHTLLAALAAVYSRDTERTEMRVRGCPCTQCQPIFPTHLACSCGSSVRS